MLRSLRFWVKTAEIMAPADRLAQQSSGNEERATLAQERPGGVDRSRPTVMAHE
jgi:hypothetical protein